ncbi:MAG TPA: DUF6510 family protein [Thermoleophilia bacterium]|nr:DUF6510 family protein [Thermoleophilia bacterium]
MAITGDSELRLDGNALAGELSRVFAVDMTAADGRCGHCGRVAPLGAQHLYRYPRAPGAVLRCSACESVLFVLVELPDGVRMTIGSLSWLRLAQGG